MIYLVSVSPLEYKLFEGSDHIVFVNYHNLQLIERMMIEMKMKWNEIIPILVKTHRLTMAISSAHFLCQWSVKNCNVTLNHDSYGRPHWFLL